MVNIVDTVEDGIQNANFTAIDKIIILRIEKAVRSINASSGQSAAIAMGNSERVNIEELFLFLKTYPNEKTYVMN